LENACQLHSNNRDQLKNEIKSINNKLYSEYYRMDCEDLIEEELKDNPHGEFLLFGLYND
jgi:hypothetical protein